MPILQFRPKEQPPEIRIEEWERELVWSFLTFMSSHGINLSLDEAIDYTQAIVNGQEVAT